MSDLISRQDVLALAKDVILANGAKHRCIDATQIYELPSAESEEFEWCHDCKEYDQEAHCCHRWTKVIRNTVEELKAERIKAERTGHWVEHLDMHPLAKEESKYVCSCCGWRTRQVEVGGHLVGGYGAEAIGAEWVCTGWKDLFYKYCPNCGASMRGVEERVTRKQSK